MVKSKVSLHKAMEAAGLTQAELARLMDTYESNVSRWLDRTQRPRPETAIELAKHLKVPLEAIYRG